MFGRKKLSVYAVASADDPESYVGYVASLKEAQEYFSNWLKVKWAESFLTWCNWHPEESPESEDSWNRYIQQDIIAGRNEDYYVYKLKFNASGVAALLRMHDLCLPFNLPFITEVEKSYFLQVTKDVKNLVLEKIRKQLAEVVGAGDVTLGESHGTE